MYPGPQEQIYIIVRTRQILRDSSGNLQFEDGATVHRATFGYIHSFRGFFREAVGRVLPSMVFVLYRRDINDEMVDDAL